MNCVCWVVAEDLTGEQAYTYDLMLKRAISALFCFISWALVAIDQEITSYAQIFVITSVFLAARFIYIELAFKSCEECNESADLLF